MEDQLEGRLHRAIEELKNLPEDVQEEVVAYIESKSDEAEPFVLTDAMKAAIAEGEADIAAGRFITGEEFFAELDRQIALCDKELEG
ncbi:MAG: hypothetical protein AAFO61_00240 [Pseudomonadota bacterium]